MTQATETDFANKVEAVKDLMRQDHMFMKPSYCEKIGRAFGLTISTYEAVDTRDQFKGLTLGGDSKLGDKARGQDAHVIAISLCNQLDVQYGHMFGVGSALRECCHELLKYLGEKE